jgi:hypothetical protein
MLITLWGTLSFSAAEVDSVPGEPQGDSVALSDTTDSLHIAMPQKKLIADPELSFPVTYNPLVSVGLSTILPGGGQVYCKRKVRGALFLATEAICALVAINRFQRYKYTMTEDINKYAREISLNYEGMLLSVNNPAEYTSYYNRYIDSHMGYDLARYRREASLYVTYHCVGWASGIYLWNILDALGSSRHFYSTNPRKPATAAWLSAIPFLGLGQIYNGAFAKTGLIWTIHTILAYMSFNYNQLMNDCINNRNQVKSTQSIPDNIKTKYIEEWDHEYRTAFKNRNTYLWYLVLFYFYGIIDAAVDAHLHDYQIKIRLGPKTETNEKSAILNLCIEF